MAYKSIPEMPEVNAPTRQRYYFNRDNRDEIDRVLSGFAYGDNTYDSDRKKAAKLLKKYNLSDAQLNDTLDSFITKHLNNRWGNDNAYMRKKVGRFETGSNLNDAQTQAQQLLKENPNAYAVAYGMHLRNGEPLENSGFKKPIVVYDSDEYKDLTDSLGYSNRLPIFNFHTLYQGTNHED